MNFCLIKNLTIKIVFILINNVFKKYIICIIIVFFA